MIASNVEHLVIKLILGTLTNSRFNNILKKCYKEDFIYFSEQEQKDFLLVEREFRNDKELIFKVYLHYLEEINKKTHLMP